MPFAHPELFEPICRWSNAGDGPAMDLELNSEGGSRGPRRYAVISSSMRAGPSLCWTCLTGAWLAGRSLALARSRSSASVSGPGKGFE